LKRLLLVDPDKFSADPLRQNRAQERSFNFDRVFGPTASEIDVQEEMRSSQGLIDNLVQFGRNGTVLAYGPTGFSGFFRVVLFRFFLFRLSIL